jgi:hypothetical protein
MQKESEKPDQDIVTTPVSKIAVGYGHWALSGLLDTAVAASVQSGWSAIWK